MKTIQTADNQAYRRLTTAELRERFLLENLFQPGRIELAYTDVDRAVVGGIVPTGAPLTLEGGREMACEFFCERREAGVINLGAAGTVTVDGTVYTLAPCECLYLGRGSRAVSFASAATQTSAQFYLVSYPAHAAFPTTHIPFAKANHVELGSAKDANRRTIHQFVLPGFVQSCQLVMGYTELHEGAVWNTFPPHTHDRRTEVYLYFDLPKNGLVMHFMGEPTETRHLAVREKDGVLSPSWSCHCGAGTGAYRFVWGMGGENQTFDDMDPASMATLA